MSRNTGIEHHFAGLAPPVFGEDFNLGKALVTCMLHPLTTFFQFDDPITHHAAIVEQVTRGGEPIADVIGKQTFGTGTFDLALKLGSHQIW